MAKVLALLGFVIACFAFSPGTAPAVGSGAASFLVPRGGLLLAIIIALQPIIITYDGWYGAIYFVEEDEDPVRNLPRSSIGGVVACIAIYLGECRSASRSTHHPARRLSNARGRCRPGGLRWSRQTDHPDHVHGVSHQHDQCIAAG